MTLYKQSIIFIMADTHICGCKKHFLSLSHLNTHIRHSVNLNQHEHYILFSTSIHFKRRRQHEFNATNAQSTTSSTKRRCQYEVNTAPNNNNNNNIVTTDEQCTSLPANNNNAVNKQSITSSKNTMSVQIQYT